MAQARRIPTREPARTPGRRSATKHAAILAAAVELVESQEAGAVTIEGIAARAGVGKQTIYRRWPNAAAVVMEAYRDRIFPPPAPLAATRSARKQLVEDLILLADSFSNLGARRALSSMAFSAATHPAVGEDFRRIVFGPRREAARALLRLGQEQGEIRADAKLEIVLEALYGPLIHRLMFGHGPVDATFVRGLIKELFRGLEP